MSEIGKAVAGTVALGIIGGAAIFGIITAGSHLLTDNITVPLSTDFRKVVSFSRDTKKDWCEQHVNFSNRLQNVAERSGGKNQRFEISVEDCETVLKPVAPAPQP